MIFIWELIFPSRASQYNTHPESYAKKLVHNGTIHQKNKKKIACIYQSRQTGVKKEIQPRSNSRKGAPLIFHEYILSISTIFRIKINTCIYVSSKPY